MHWTASQTDPIDAALHGELLGGDLLDVATIVRDLQAAYLRRDPMRRSAALAAFTGVHLDGADSPAVSTDDGVVPVSVAGHSGDTGDPASTERKRNKMLSTVSGLVGSLTGKAVLGTAVAAASVGGLHAADVVDVPALPDNDRPAVEAPAGGEDSTGQGGPAAQGAEGQQTAADKQAAAQAHAEAVRQWTDCVAAAASAQGDAETRVTGGFDPRDACGEHPQLGDFGLTDVPSQASDAARQAVAETPGAGSIAQQPGSRAPAGSGSAATPGVDAPAGPPTDLPVPAADQAGSGSSGDGTPAGSGGSAPATPPTSDVPAAGRP
jgi:hypothetical protein